MADPKETAAAYLLGAAIEREAHQDTAYELSAEQVAEIRRRLLDGTWDCVWCHVKLRAKGGEPAGKPHADDCLLAEICEVPK